MAASDSKSTSDQAGTTSDARMALCDAFWAAQGPVVQRDPPIKLLSPVSGFEPVSWAEDHRLAASSDKCVSVVELMCGIHSISQNMILHRSHVPLSDTACELKVGPEKQVEVVKEGLAKSKDPIVSQMLMMDRTIYPHGGRLHGVKYTSWSPLGCDEHGRCLLAVLTMDNHLAIYSSPSHLCWKPRLDLTALYGEMLNSRNYSAQNDDSHSTCSIENLDELQRRYHMQMPASMEWSGLCNKQQVQTNNACRDVNTVLLAVLMENGDVVVWQFSLPMMGKDSVVSSSTIKSGVLSPSKCTWWEYEHSGRKMSGLVVGSSDGPVKILPVNLKAVKGYFTLRQPVVLWPERDQIPVLNIKCITLFHPHQKCNCSLVVVARGPYVFWCLLIISKAGLNVHNSHITGLHSTPIISMTVSHHDGTIFTCSLDGKVKKLTVVFTDTAVKFKQEEVVLPEGVAGRRIHGISVSPNSAYLALLSSEGMLNGLHSINHTYQVQFITLKTPDEAAVELLEAQNLFRKTDLLDLVRWRILKDKAIPLAYLNNLDDKLQVTRTTYLLRLKLFLFRILYQSMEKTPSEAYWQPTQTTAKDSVVDTEAGGDADETMETSTLEEATKGGGKVCSAEVQKINIGCRIEEVEYQLLKENMKKVLSEVYLRTCITQNTCIPTKGMCDFLKNDPDGEDRTAKVLIGHIMNKMNKQTFPEYCSLCKEILPFTNCRQTECKNGHIWLRCALSYQACQNMTYRRCLLQDSIASVAEPEDSDWIRKILQGSCIYCDSPFY